MLDVARMDPTLTTALRARPPLLGLLELLPIMLVLLGVLVLVLVSFESGRALAGVLDTREQSLAIMMCGMVLNAAWPPRCAWLRR